MNRPETATTRFQIRLSGPLDLAGTLAPLGRWGDDDLDRWDGRRLLRIAHLPTGRLVYLARPSGTPELPALHVTAAAGASSQQDALRREIETSLAGDVAALAALAAEDPAIGALARRYPGLRPVLLRDPFTALVRSISAQQVNLRWAAEVRRRICRRFGHRHELEGESAHSLDARILASAAEPELRALGLTGAKSRSVLACARAASEGRLELAKLAALDDEEVSARLTALPGIGRWSADWFLVRTLGRPRVVGGDLGVRKAVGRLYGAGALPGEAEVRRLTAHWGVAAAMAQVVALHDLAVRSSND
ncbi:MAG TPA: hypothetical protein VMP67_06590 [Candidatus Limnocylindria bacterium]|nr:hypothetical protein [Candidatus Limnocylindria bacterium]